MGVWACAACGGENPEGTRFCGHCGAAVSEPAETAPDVADALRNFVVGTIADKLVESGGHVPEERRLITALFADISGFTPLADRLDPEELLEVIDPVVSGLSSVVARYEGYVEKFAGDALLALFGAPVSHDDDAARALRVALEMHEELERLKAELPADAAGLGLHVGVNSGHGIARVLGSEARMDYAVLGDAVILAQRLESAAPSGETYVSESTARLAEHRFELEPVGELTLKGKAEPVPAWRLVGERESPARAGRSRMIGRAREVALLGEAFERGGAVSITGEPGVGKSRLVEETRQAAEQRGLRRLSARCLSYGAALPYWPFADLLRRSGDLLGESNPFFATLLGAERPEIEPEAFQRGLHGAFRAWLQELEPAVLVLEDAHWLDAASQALVAELARLEVPRVLLVTARPEAEATLAATLPERTRIELAPLDEQGVETLLEEQLGGAPPRELAAFVWRRTAGNPFFVQELVRALEDSDALGREADGSWRMRAGWDARSVPPTVEEVLSGRMDALPRAAATTLQTASVIGRRVPEPLLSAVGGDPASLDQLVAAGFFDDDPEHGVRVVVFQHALVQDVAYERLLRRQRRELHLRVAEQAESLYGAGDDVIDLLARHLYLGGGARAPEYLRRAAGRARRLYANEEAILHLARCAELVPDDVELRLELAELHELVGDYDEALELYERIRSEATDVRALRGLLGTLRKRGRYSDALAEVEAAFADERLRGLDLLPVWLEAGWTLSLTGQIDQAIHTLEQALVLAGDRSDTTVGRIQLELARACLVQEQADRALEWAVSARRSLEASADLQGLATALRVTGSILSVLERPEEAAQTLREGLATAERVGSVEEIGGCLINLGMVELDRGRFVDAEACNRRAIEEFERVGHGSGRAWGYSNLAWTLANAGSLDDAAAECARSLEFSRSIGHAITVASTLDTIALVALGRGAWDEAVESADEAAKLFVELGVAGKASDALLRAGEALERLGEDERARATRARARELVEPVVPA